MLLRVPSLGRRSVAPGHLHVGWRDEKPSAALRLDQWTSSSTGQKSWSASCRRS